MIGSTGVVSKIDFNCKPTYLIIGVWPTARRDVFCLSSSLYCNTVETKLYFLVIINCEKTLKII